MLSVNGPCAGVPVGVPGGSLPCFAPSVPAGFVWESGLRNLFRHIG